MRLIDADELRKNMEFICMGIMAGTEPYNAPLTEIDNAPTVETDIEVATKDAYEHGYTDGWKERFGEPDERPQGEWIPLSAHNIYRCSECGRTIELTIDETLSDYPYCHCGADMRGGAE